MNNADMPAMPLASEELSDRFYEGVALETGLTKREYFAGLALQGILSKYSGQISDISEKAVKCADALLKELSK